MDGPLYVEVAPRWRMLLESVLWENGMGPPAPDIPKMVSFLGGRKEESSRSEGKDPGRRWEDFSKKIRTTFEECRSSRVSGGTAKEVEILGLIQGGRRDGETIVDQLTEWLHNGMTESYIGRCIWGPENEHGGSKEGSLSTTNLSDEDMTQTRWSTGETLSRSWERL